MNRAIILALVCCGCTALRNQKPREAECVYAGEAFSRKGTPVVEAETFGPSKVIWMHPEEHEGYLIVRDRHLYRCDGT